MLTLSTSLRAIRSVDLLERRVVEHQLPLAAVAREADGDDAAGLDPSHDALAEGAVTHGVTGGQRKQVLLRLDVPRLRWGAVVPPGGRAQPLALDVAVGELV